MNIDLNDFCEGCKEKYCFLMSMLELNKKDNRRLLMQFKMIETFKYVESEKENKDLGWEESLKRWVDGGLAKKFADVYEDKLSVTEMKKKLF